MILVVSKDDEVRATLVRVLGTTGEPVEASATTWEALGRAHDARVVVLDLLTDGVDGQAFRDVSERVVVVGVYEDVPIVIGPDRYLKSFTLARLVEAVGVKA